MNKKEFKMLSFADKIKYFNGKLGEGQTVTRIREDIGIGEKGWQKEVKKNGYKYDTKSKIYVEIISTTETTTNNKSMNLSLMEHEEIQNYISRLAEIL